MMGVPIKWAIIGLVALGGVGVGGYFYFSDPEAEAPRLDPLPELIYNRVSEDIARMVSIPHGTEKVLLAPVPNDSAELRLRVRDRLRKRGGFKVELLSPDARESTIGKDLQEYFSKWLNVAVTGRIAEEERQEGPEILLVAHVAEFVDNDEEYRLKVEFTQKELSVSGEETLVTAQPVEHGVSKSLFDLDYLKIRIGSSSRPLRIAIWLAVLIVPPVIFLRPIRRTLGQESNMKNAMLVVLWAIPASVCGWILTAFGSGLTGGGIALLAAVLSVAYSYMFLTLAEQSRK